MIRKKPVPSLDSGDRFRLIRYMRLGRTDHPAGSIQCDRRRDGERTLATAVVWKVKETSMIRKLSSGQYRLYSRKINPKTGKRRNLGTFKSRAAAEKHERAVQYFKRH
jgi:hypothetical protein